VLFGARRGLGSGLDKPRDYFYFANRRRPGCEEETLYDLLGVPHSASPTDLRLAGKVRSLELETAHQNRYPLRAIEPAFNLLANPDLRSCYDSLLLDHDAPALFPFGGFGSVAVAGELSADRATFFAARILSFLPDYRTRRFGAPLRRIEFLNNRAVYRDSRRKAEVSWTSWSCRCHRTRCGINGNTS
jgi:curved DNA-binding protein CbpA